MKLSKRSNSSYYVKYRKRNSYWKKNLKACSFPYFKTFGKILESWEEEIARMWRYAKNNAITEGLYRKMKLIQRRAYGFKNFENYRLRVKVSCG